MKDFIAAAEKHTKLMLDAERYIWQNPETGYKEVKTSAYMAQIFRDLGYELTMAEGITGFYTTLDTGRPGPCVLVLAELDSVICPAHPEADPETGAVHSCGHHAQCAALAGVAAALKEPGILDRLCGKIKLCTVPAEELLEIEFRTELKRAGKIRYFGGKGEFLARGYFDDVDMAFMVHTSSAFAVKQGSVGCLAKRVVYKGTAAHAGGAPWQGRNALYAATCGLGAVNAIRETFKESDIIRVHPIITHGGAMVNAIPEFTVLESYIRGRTFDAICAANRKVNQALCGSALSLDTNVEIIDNPGYAPLINDQQLRELTAEAAALTVPEYPFEMIESIGSGSTDLGDLSCVMPVVHPYAAGAEGKSHGSNYYIVDPVAACVGSAKLQMGMLLLLLGNGGERAKQIIDSYEPPFKKDDYLAFMDSLCAEGDRIEYCADGSAKIRLG